MLALRIYLKLSSTVISREETDYAFQVFLALSCDFVKSISLMESMSPKRNPLLCVEAVCMCTTIGIQK